MGNLLKNKKSKASKKASISSNRIVHKARVLTIADVEANRSMAYTYLDLR